MSVTAAINSVNVLRGQSGPKGELSVIEVAVQLSGTYLTASKPNVDIAAALRACRFGLTSYVGQSIALFGAMVLRDRYDGTNRYTAPAAGLALSSTGTFTNNVLTFRVDSGATNGATGTEVGDGTSVNGSFTFVVLAALQAQ